MNYFGRVLRAGLMSLLIGLISLVGFSGIAFAVPVEAMVNMASVSSMPSMIADLPWIKDPEVGVQQQAALAAEYEAAKQAAIEAGNVPSSLFGQPVEAPAVSE